jgi:hypothetical protein
VRKSLPPVLLLFIVAPVFGELFSGSTRLNDFLNPVTFTTEALLYGCGAIIARELVVRWGKGWPSLLLLGFAYGIYEEGLLVQSFFNPAWHDLGTLAVFGRVAGVNWVWAEHLTIYHALISIAASVAFVEALYPGRRGERWVASRRWWLANWIGFLGVYLLWQPLLTYDSGAWKPLSALVILALALAARLVPARLLPPVKRRAPMPWVFWCAGFLGYFVQFILVYRGADQGAYPFGVALLLVPLFDLLVLGVVLRWSGNGAAWDDRHRLALLGGALSFFLVFGLLTVGRQYPVMYFSHPVFLLLLWLAAPRVDRRFISPARAPA